MRQISCVDVDDTNVLDEVARVKRRARRNRILAARSRVVRAYNSYEEEAPEVGAIVHAALTNEEANALRHCYEVETAPLSTLRGRIFAPVSSARCPFCSINDTSTLDHYLPKETYPEFSIFSKNLVPCCAHCNTNKGTKLLEQDGDVRLFLHPYFDRVPETRFLVASVVIREDTLGLTYRIVRADGVNRDVFRRLKSHFVNLKLDDRYRRMGLEHLSGRYGALKRAYGDRNDAGRVSTELEGEAERFELQYGLNHWLSVLFRSLSSLEEFCDGGFDVLRQIR